MARVVKAAQDDEGNVADMKALEAAVAEYDKEYVFTLASVGGGRKSTDPVDTAANRIARAAITAKLKADGRAVKDVDKDQLAAAIAKLAATDAVRKAAAKEVKERAALAEASLADIDI